MSSSTARELTRSGCCCSFLVFRRGRQAAKTLNVPRHESVFRDLPSLENGDEAPPPAPYKPRAPREPADAAFRPDVRQTAAPPLPTVQLRPWRMPAFALGEA